MDYRVLYNCIRIVNMTISTVDRHDCKWSFQIRKFTILQWNVTQDLDFHLATLFIGNPGPGCSKNPKVCSKCDNCIVINLWSYYLNFFQNTFFFLKTTQTPTKYLKNLLAYFFNIKNEEEFFLFAVWT